MLSLFAGVILIGLLVNRTLAVTSKQVSFDGVAPVEVDAAAVGRLSEAIRYRTIAGRDSRDSSAFMALDSFIQKSYPGIDTTLERLSMPAESRVFRWPGQNAKLPPILLLAHLDVVPAEPESLDNWTYPPFSGQVDTGFIWGRGTLDDKSSAFAMLEAIEMLLSENYQPQRTVYLSLGEDEEIGGGQGAARVAEYFENRGIRFDYVLDEGYLILEDNPVGIDPPLAIIGTAEKGGVNLRLTARTGAGGHSSMPPQETAVDLLSRSISRLRENPFPAKIDGPTASFFEYVSPEMGFLSKAVFANLWLTKPLVVNRLEKDPATNAMIRTTIAPTMLEAGLKPNVLPSTATATLNFRILPGETIESVTAYVKEIIADDRIEVGVADGAMRNPSPVSSTESFGFQIIQRTIVEIFPDAIIAPSLVVGGTDSRHFIRVSDHIYRFLPISVKQSDLKRFHGIDERVEKQDYLDAIRFYRRLIINSCK